MNLRRLIACILGLLTVAPLAHAQTISAYYKLEDLPTPPGLVPLVGGLDFTPDGRLVACFHHGEVAIMDPKTRQWSLFAEGLHEPLGVLAVSNHQIIVCQRPEVTRITDTDGDGKADLYENLTDAFGISRNYHEFVFGPVRDSSGNLYFITSPASAGAGVAYETRGKYNPDGRDPYQDYSPVPYRGWCWKLTPEGKAIPFASGFRQANGLGFDAQGRLFATDNQGEWIGSSKLLHIHEGRFHGFGMSRVWEPTWPGGNPLSYPVEKHDRERVRESIMFPHGAMANSPTQPVLAPADGSFGPFAGQFIIGEMNHQRLLRVGLEEVGGELQGFCVPFYDFDGLKMGQVRLVFGPDHALYTGQTFRQGWVGDAGIQRLTWTGKTPPEVHTMRVTSKGFELTFTLPLDASSATLPGAYKFRRSYYRYHRRYDARQFDVHEVPVTAVAVSPDRRSVSLELAEMVPGYVYELTLTGIKTETGAPIVNPYLAYTLNRLKDGTPGYQKPAVLVQGDTFTLDPRKAQELANCTIISGGTSGGVEIAAKDGHLEQWFHTPREGMYEVTVHYTLTGSATPTLRYGINSRLTGNAVLKPTPTSGGATFTYIARVDEGDNAVELQGLPANTAGTKPTITRFVLKRVGELQ